MPVLVRYCNKCGIRIAPLDLEMGRAIKHKGGYYCAKCAGELVVVAEVVEEEEEPEARKPLPAARRPAAHVAPNRVPVRHVTKERAHHEDAPRGEYRQAKTNLLPLYLLIIGVFVALVAVVLIVNRQQTVGTQPAAGTQQPANTHQPSGTAGNIPPPDLGRKTSAGVDPEVADRLRAEFDAIIKHAGDEPKELNVAISGLKMFLTESGLPMTLASDARSKLKEYTTKLNELAAEEFEKTQTKVAGHLAALEFDKALKVLEDFPDIYASTNAPREVDKEMQRVAFEKGAHGKYLEVIEAAGKALEKGELERARDRFSKWLIDFGGTFHDKEVGEKLVAVVEKIKSERQLRRLGIQKEFRELEKLTAGLSKKEKHEEAARAWRDFADKYPGEKDLVGKALASARTSEELAAKAAAKAAVRPKEPRYRLDFTGSSVVSTMKKHKYEAATLKSADNGGKCLSMPAPEGSVLRMEFEVEEVPDRLILALEHAGPKPPPGKKWKVLVDIKLNGKEVMSGYELGDTFKVDPFNIAKLVKKGTNVLEITPAKKTEAAYLLKKVGIAKVLEDAFKPLGKEPTSAGGDGKETPASGSAVFDGKTLKGWKTNGPGKWEVKDSIIVGRHTGKNPKDIGFVFPLSEQSKKWLDYKLTFDVKCNVAGGWQVALRAREATGGLVSGNVLDAGEGFSSGQWWSISLRVEGDTVYASVDGSDEHVQGKDNDKLPGTFAFGVKLGAIVEFKNIKFELLKAK